MLQKMGLGVFGGVQVSYNVKYYGMNKNQCEATSHILITGL